MAQEKEKVIISREHVGAIELTADDVTVVNPAMQELKEANAVFMLARRKMEAFAEGAPERAKLYEQVVRCQRVANEAAAKKSAPASE